MSAPSYSDSPRNAANYLGQTYKFTPLYYRTRNPTVLDIRPKENQGYYPIGSIWINASSPPEIWILARISRSSNAVNAEWVLIANSLIAGPLLTLSDNTGTVVTPTSDVANPPGNIQFLAGTGISITAGTNTLTVTNTGSGTETLTGDDAVAVSPSGGTIQTLGNVVANATHSKALFTTNSAGNIERFDIQVGAAIASSNIAKVGLAAFSNAQFSVDANGFVTLAGGSGSPTLGFTPDAHTAPGTTPVVPNGSGNIILEGGATFSTGTLANPIRTNSLAANTIDLQIQLAGANPAVSTANNFGVAQFDSNSFGVASGFVTLNNAGTAGPVTKLLGDDGGANSVVPSSGVVTLDGVTVTNATNAKPVFFKKNAASTEELDVQLTTTSTSGAKNINKSGLCHFDNTDFTVDAATGFVQLAGGASPAIETITGDAGGAVGPTGSPENINWKSATTTYVTGTPGSSSLKTEVVSTLNTFLLGAGATTASTTLGPLTNGQLIIGNTGSAPSLAGIIAGSGISVTNGPGTITIAATATGMTWQLIGASQTLAANNGYFCTTGGALSLALPTSGASLGTTIEVILDGSTSWTITQSAGQQIRFGTSQTTLGAGGSLASTAQGNSVTLVCEVANLRWVAFPAQGNITVV